MPLPARLYVAYLRHRNPGPPVATDYVVLEMKLWCIEIWVLALALFLALRLSSRLQVSNAILKTLAGFVAVLGLPVGIVYGQVGMNDSAWLDERLIFGELIAATTIVLLFRMGKWVKFSSFVPFLCGHFAIWGWASWSRLTTASLYPFFLGLSGSWALFIVAGLCSGFLWGLYIKQQRRQRASSS